MGPIYVVTEIKTVPEGTAVLISTTQHSSRQSAESQYYGRVATAANPDNTFPKHTVILAANDGTIIDVKSYTHGEEPEPEVEEA